MRIARARHALASLLLVAACAEDPGATPVPPDPFDDSWRGEQVTAIADGRWSQPSTWEAGRVPREGDVVVIPAGRTVYLDTETAALHTLELGGVLQADPLDVALTAETIRVAGLLQIGAEDAPFAHRAVITLIGRSGGGRAELEAGLGRRVLAALPGGRLELHGERRTTWTRLTSTALAGSDRIQVEEALGWRVGDVVALTPSHYAWDATDERTIVEVIDARTFRLDAPLQHYHFGELQEIEGFAVDERAEVGLLSRNVVVRGEPTSVETAIGGHMIFLRESTVHLSGIEAVHLGQRGVLGRYPIHWHLARDVDGSYVRDSSIHHSFHRCVTLHTTQNARVERNFAYDTFGHCFFFEDALETGNHIVENVGAMVRLLPPEDRVENPNLSDDHDDRFDDKHDRRSSVFWITNPNNHWIGNVAAGAEHGMGFWFDLRRGQDDDTGEEVRTEGTPLGTFRGNVAHSISSSDRNNHGYGPQQAGSGLTFEGFHMRPEEGGSFVDGFVAYKCFNHGVWSDGTIYLRDVVLVGNRVGIANSHFFGVSRLVNALVSGESANRPFGMRNADDPPRSLSFSGPIGMELFKGSTSFENVTFAHFPGAHYGNVAFYVSESYGKHNQWFAGVRLVDAVPLRIKSDEDDPIVLLGDLDGSLTGAPSTLVVDGDLGPVLGPECAAMDEAWDGVTRCPYLISMLRVSGHRGSNSAAGVRLVHADGSESAVGAGDALTAPIRTLDGATVRGLPDVGEPHFASRFAPSVAVRVTLESSVPRFGFHLDDENKPDRGRPLPVVPLAELEAQTVTSVAVDAEGRPVLWLFGWDTVALCTDATCAR